MTARFALIPTHNRPEHLANLVSSLRGQCEAVVVIDNASDPPVSDELHTRELPVVVVRNGDQPPNLSRLWNVGFNEIRMIWPNLTAWDVAVFNDDVVLPAGWYNYVSSALRSSGAAVACSDAYGHVHERLLKTEPDRSLVTRMCPWAFIVKGELGLRADEQFHWWWGDTDLDWQARAAGGVVILPGYITANLLANSTTHGALAEQAGRDGEAFVRKWGYRPW